MNVESGSLYMNIDSRIKSLLSKVNMVDFFKNLFVLSQNSQIHVKLFLSYLQNFWDYKTALYVVKVLNDYEQFYVELNEVLLGTSDHVKGQDSQPEQSKVNFHLSFNLKYLIYSIIRKKGSTLNFDIKQLNKELFYAEADEKQRKNLHFISLVNIVSFFLIYLESLGNMKYMLLFDFLIYNDSTLVIDSPEFLLILNRFLIFELLFPDHQLNTLILRKFNKQYSRKETSDQVYIHLNEEVINYKCVILYALSDLKSLLNGYSKLILSTLATSKGSFNHKTVSLRSFLDSQQFKNTILDANSLRKSFLNYVFKERYKEYFSFKEQLEAQIISCLTMRDELLNDPKNLAKVYSKYFKLKGKQAFKELLFGYLVRIFMSIQAISANLSNSNDRDSNKERFRSKSLLGFNAKKFNLDALEKLSIMNESCTGGIKQRILDSDQFLSKIPESPNDSEYTQLTGETEAINTQDTSKSKKCFKISVNKNSFSCRKSPISTRYARLDHIPTNEVKKIKFPSKLDPTPEISQINMVQDCSKLYDSTLDPFFFNLQDKIEYPKSLVNPNNDLETSIIKIGKSKKKLSDLTALSGEAALNQITQSYIEMITQGITKEIKDLAKENKEVLLRMAKEEKSGKQQKINEESLVYTITLGVTPKKILRILATIYEEEVVVCFVKILNFYLKSIINPESSFSVNLGTRIFHKLSKDSKITILDDDYLGSFGAGVSVFPFQTETDDLIFIAVSPVKMETTIYVPSSLDTNNTFLPKQKGHKMQIMKTELLEGGREKQYFNLVLFLEYFWMKMLRKCEASKPMQTDTLNTRLFYLISSLYFKSLESSNYIM